MEANKILTGYLVDVENETAKFLTIADELDEFYRILNCSCIDIVRRRIGGRSKKIFTIVCDDEGLFKVPQKISAIDNLGAPQLVGNIFIVGGGTDDDGNLISLTSEEAVYISRRIQKIYTRLFPAGYPALTQCEY